jgi:hypothetical protein
VQNLLVLAARVALAVCLLLTFVGAFGPPGVGPGLFPWDKANHFCAFFAITAAAIVALPRLGLIWIGVGASGIGAAIELLQALPFIRRDCDFWDWTADDAGIAAVLGVVILAGFRQRVSDSSS